MAREDEHGTETACCGACAHAARVARGEVPERAPLGALRVRPGEGWSLRVTARGGPTAEHRYQAESVRVGRGASNDLVLPSGTVSRVTCRFFVREETLYVEDLRSTCGTYVNGRAIREPTALRAGDEVHVGDFVLAP